MEVWIGRDGERHGPYKEGDVRQWLRSGQVSRDDLGWYEGLADWQPLSVLFPEERPSTTPPPMQSSPYAAPPLSQAATINELEDYAGFWKRLVAYIIDCIVLYIPNMLIQKLMGGDVAGEALRQAQMANRDDPQQMVQSLMTYYSAMTPAMLAISVVTLLYFAFCESSAWQATVGKLAMGIRVTDLEGQRISLPRALGRYLGKFISALILCIGFLMVAWTRRSQGLHDIMANTLVLNGRANRQKAAASNTTRNDSFNA